MGAISGYNGEFFGEGCGFIMEVKSINQTGNEPSGLTDGNLPFEIFNVNILVMKGIKGALKVFLPFSGTILQPAYHAPHLCSHLG